MRGKERIMIGVAGATALLVTGCGATATNATMKVEYANASQKIATAKRHKPPKTHETTTTTSTSTTTTSTTVAPTTTIEAAPVLKSGSAYVHDLTSPAFWVEHTVAGAAPGTVEMQAGYNVLDPGNTKTGELPCDVTTSGTAPDQFEVTLGADKVEVAQPDEEAGAIALQPAFISGIVKLVSANQLEASSLYAVALPGPNTQVSFQMLGQAAAGSPATPTDSSLNRFEGVMDDVFEASQAYCKAQN